MSNSTTEIAYTKPVLKELSVAQGTEAKPGTPANELRRFGPTS